MALEDQAWPLCSKVMGLWWVSEPLFSDVKWLVLFCCQDEDSEFTIATDFEIGHFFRERIVPRAVLYFTGEALEDDESVGPPHPPSRTLSSPCPKTH